MIIRQPDTPPGCYTRVTVYPAVMGGRVYPCIEVSGPVVPRTSVPAQGTASGSHTLIATATSRDSVEIVLDNGEVVDISLSEKFRTTCSELGSSAIGRWMLDLGVTPWPKGKPPEFDLEPPATEGFGWPGDEKKHPSCGANGQEHC